MAFVPELPTHATSSFAADGLAPPTVKRDPVVAKLADLKHNMHFAFRDLAATFRRACVVLVAASALTFVADLSGILPQALAATPSECEDEFADSSADDTCELSDATASGDECTKNATCEAIVLEGKYANSTVYVQTSITVDLDDVDDLVNFDGILTSSSC